MRPDMQKFSFNSTTTLYSNIAEPEDHTLCRLRCMSALLLLSNVYLLSGNIRRSYEWIEMMEE